MARQATQQGTNVSVTDADKGKKPLQQFTVQITSADNWDALISYAAQQHDDDGNPLTVHRAVKALVFSHVPNMDRSKENERAAKGSKTAASTNLVKQVLGDKVKDKSAKDLKKINDIALAEAMKNPDVMAVVRAAMASVASNIDAAERNAEADKLAR